MIDSSVVGANSLVYVPDVSVKYRYEFVLVELAFTEGPNASPNGDSVLSILCRYPGLEIVSVTIWNRDVIAPATF